ncbi:AI-2E family transporter [Leucobacter sp. UCMA 4100]|uniref:AI-2E family transporter n=1 Tax=Leucobacter sp. UCMA 4100 TaxID=2810534 RepID=UPI0022EAA460|nr:AI-2E family transporter [Leucobacter sp. UCMA 4100]MDA3147574.1 AI-2E family transporter [Leucobacter sp. UCMA 4100]
MEEKTPTREHLDLEQLDADTREMYRDALKAEPSLQDRVEEQQSKRYLGIRNPFKVGFVVTLGALTAIVFGQAIGQISSVIVYVVAALFIALGLDPIVRMFERRNVKRPVGIAIVFLSFLLIVAGILAIVVPMISNQIALVVKNGPQYILNINKQDWFIDLNAKFGHYLDLDGLLSSAQDFAMKPDTWTQFAGGLVQAGVGLANGITAALIVLILSLYFLASLRTMKKGLYSMTPRSSRAKVIDITEQVTQSIGGYVNGMVILALINASLGFIAMTIFKVPFAGLLAVAIFFVALIPLIGSVLATILVVIVSLFNSPITALSIGIYYLIYMQIESYFLTPRIMNRVVSVPGSLVVIGAIAGGTLLGLLGALIAIPVTAMVLMIIKQVWVPRQQFR